MISKTVYIGLGSNLGDRERQLVRAVRSLIDVHPDPKKRIPLLTSVARSHIYETAPVGVTSQPAFLNAVLKAQTTHTPEDLLTAVKHIERELGRVERDRWGPREIDIDILHLEGCERDIDPVLPHPRMHERAFVLAPLSELAPDLVLSHLDKSVRELLVRAITRGEQVRRWRYQWDHPRLLDDTKETLPAVCLRDVTPNVIKGAFATHGALRITSAIDSERVDELEKLSREAFAATTAVKKLSRRAGAGGGYTPPSIERVIGHGPDPMRHFWDVAGSTSSRVIEVRQFYEHAGQVRSTLVALGETIAHAFDAAYGTEVASSLAGGEHLLRTSQYLNERVSELDVLFPSHSDFGLLTFYLGGAASGLEAKLDGAWRSVSNPPGSVIVGVGTTLGLYAPDGARPFRHRVVGGSLGRISSVCFIEPHIDTLLPSGVRWRERLAGLMCLVRARR